MLFAIREFVNILREFYWKKVGNENVLLLFVEMQKRWKTKQNSGKNQKETKTML